jgi:hypothetical protein
MITHNHHRSNAPFDMMHKLEQPSFSLVRLVFWECEMSRTKSPSGRHLQSYDVSLCFPHVWGHDLQSYRFRMQQSCRRSCFLYRCTLRHSSYMKRTMDRLPHWSESVRTAGRCCCCDEDAHMRLASWNASSDQFDVTASVPKAH